MLIGRGAGSLQLLGRADIDQVLFQLLLRDKQPVKELGSEKKIQKYVEPHTAVVCEEE